jgi:CCR4-NOT transcription complex subunit 7/8
MSPALRDGSMVKVVDVRASNEEEELFLLRACARDFPIAAVATSLDLPPPARTLDGAYDAVRAAVDRDQSAQVGLALFNCAGDLALGGRVWRFHLGDGHADANPYRVCEAFRACTRAAVPDGVWVTRDGAADVAYLVRHMNGGILPPKREAFLHLCNAFFHDLYDLKVLAEWRAVEDGDPPLALDVDFSRFIELVPKWGFKDLMTGYNAFLWGLGAADEYELLIYKKAAAEQQESRRRLSEKLRQKGISEEHIRHTLFHCVYNYN